MMRFFKATTVRDWELWPLVACLGFWMALFTVVVYKAFSHSEIWLDRSKVCANVTRNAIVRKRLQPLPPWDWERDRDIYYKKHATMWDTVHGL